MVRLEELAAIKRSAELSTLRSEGLSRSDSSFSPKSTEKNPTNNSDDEYVQFNVIKITLVVLCFLKFQNIKNRSKP